MPIRFNCEACTARIKVPDATEGKLVKCPGCGQAQRVPEESAEEAPPAVAAEPVRARKSAASPPSPSQIDDVASESEQAAGDGVSSDVDTPEPVAVPSLVPGEQPDSAASVAADVDTSESLAGDSALDALAALGDATDGSVAGDIDQAASPEPAVDVDSDEQSESVKEEMDEAFPVGAEEDEDDNDGGYAEEADSGEESVAESDANNFIEPTSVSEAPVAVARRRTDPRSSGRRASDRRPTPPPKLTGLLIVGWMLRILAVVGVGGVVKFALWMSDSNASVVDILFATPLVLGLVVMFWAVGELALATRGRLRKDS